MCEKLLQWPKMMRGITLSTWCIPLFWCIDSYLAQYGRKSLFLFIQVSYPLLRFYVMNNLINSECGPWFLFVIMVANIIFVILNILGLEVLLKVVIRSSLWQSQQVSRGFAKISLPLQGRFNAPNPITTIQYTTLRIGYVKPLS